ncbi:MAG: DNA mismatch repair endonuclease MutL [Byssovorax sp.]
MSAPPREPRRVRVLPEDLSNQIAAGEVVERPASVVKELIENALDAGARRIRIDIAQGGVELVRISDDGAGMEREDAALSVLRHATSKLIALDDLQRIQSFGFRGEALPSIASVSRFLLRTRRAEDAEGTQVKVDGGSPAEVGPCGCAAGTTVEVRELFYNVPARRKFLKATATESARVTEVVQNAALGEPGITLILSRDGRTAAEWLRASSREERARSVFAGEELAACKGERGPLTVEAYLSRPERARSGATALSIFVNGRPVRDRTLSRSIALAYGSVLEQGKYPIGVAYLDLPPDLVDVNVHPQKAEVRFADGRAVGDALYKIVSAAVCSAFGLPAPGGFRGKKQKLFEEPEGPAASTWVWGASSTPSTSSTPSPSSTALPTVHEAPDPWGLTGDPRPPIAEEAAPPARSAPEPAQRSLHMPPPAPRAQAAPAHPAPAPAQAPAAIEAEPAPIPYPTVAELMAARAEKGAAFGSLRFVAQVRSTFLICEGPDGLYVLDQHAAAERVTFARLRKAYDAREVSTQALLFPEVIEAQPSEVALIEEAQDAVLRVGLDVRPAGVTSLAIHAVPSILRRASPERLVRDLLGEISHQGERAFSGAIDRAIATMACHGSIRAGDPVPPEEARALLHALDEVEFAGHCPHGRPVVMRIGWGELEQRVGRR